MRYLTATAIGLAVCALLLPIAGRALGPGLQVKPYAPNGILKAPSTAASVVKAEGEFLAYGAMSEFGNAGATSAARALHAGVAETRAEVSDVARSLLPSLAPRVVDVSSDTAPTSFGAWAARARSDPTLETREGLVTAVEGVSE
jgi:hypothetical protein